jgi:hypothetical protein
VCWRVQSFYLWKLRRDNIVLILAEVQVKHRSRARCAQADKDLRTLSKVRVVEGLLSQELHKVNQFKYLGVFEEVLQGVRAGVIPRVLEDFKQAQEG